MQRKCTPLQDLCCKNYYFNFFISLLAQRNETKKVHPAARPLHCFAELLGVKGDSMQGPRNSGVCHRAVSIERVTFWRNSGVCHRAVSMQNPLSLFKGIFHTFFACSKKVCKEIAPRCKTFAVRITILIFSFLCLPKEMKQRKCTPLQDLCIALLSFWVLKVIQCKVRATAGFATAQ